MHSGLGVDARELRPDRPRRRAAKMRNLGRIEALEREERDVGLGTGQLPVEKPLPDKVRHGAARRCDCGLVQPGAKDQPPQLQRAEDDPGEKRDGRAGFDKQVHAPAIFGEVASDVGDEEDRRQGLEDHQKGGHDRPAFQRSSSFLHGHGLRAPGQHSQQDFPAAAARLEGYPGDMQRDKNVEQIDGRFVDFFPHAVLAACTFGLIIVVMITPF